MSLDLWTQRSAAAGPRRLRLEPIWLHAVWLFFGTGAAVAEIDRLDLERQPGRHVIAGAAAATDGGLWLLRRVEHLDARFEVESVRHTLTEISPSLEIERELALSEGDYVAVAAFASGVLVAREFPDVAPSRTARATRPASRRTAQLRAVSAQPPFERTLYEWSLPTAGPFAASPAASAAAASVYVIEYTGMSEPERWTGALVKVSADGEVLWRWELSDSPIDVVATEQGALVLGWAPRAASTASAGRARQAVTSLTADGRFSWREEFSFEHYISELMLAEPAKLVLVARGSAEAVLDLSSPSLAAFQRPPGGYTLSFYPISAHVAHGRLIRLGRGYGQPYLSIQNFRDDPPVTVRFQLMSGSRFSSDAVYPNYGGIVVLPLATNRLALVAEWTDALPSAPGADLPEFVGHSAVIATDIEARDLVAAHGACVTGDVEALAAAEHRLREDFGVSVSLGTAMLAGRRPLDANGCELPSDADYALFMDELREELTRRAARPWRDMRLYVVVDAFDVPYRLQQYSSHSFAVHGLSGPSIGFVARPDGASALAAYIANVVEPFHAEMNRLRNEFGTLTQRTLSVSWNASTGSVDDDLALLRLEQSAERIVAEARRLSPEEREALRRKSEPLVFHFDGERFGVAADMKPLASARETLLDATRNRPRRRR